MSLVHQMAVIGIMADLGYKSISVNNNSCKVQSVACNWIGTNYEQNEINLQHNALHITEQRVRPFPFSDHNCCQAERWAQGYLIKNGKKQPSFQSSLNVTVYPDKFVNDNADFKWNGSEFIAIDHPGLRNYSKNDGESELFTEFKILVFDKCGGQKKKVFERKENYWITVAAKPDFLFPSFIYDKGGFDNYGK